VSTGGKILSTINTWDDFFSHAQSLKEKGKGDIFEYLTKLILTTKPEYSSILKNIWLYNEIPTGIRNKLNLPARDEGIDLIAETYHGQYWAIQCKFKGHNESPTFKELSTFAQLANNFCKNVSLALLVHTGERGVRKRYLLGEKYSELGLEFWLGLTSEDWESIHRSLKHKPIRPKPRVPRPHQDKAIAGAVKHYIENGATRGRLIMPCGTGKSLAAFWIANALNAKSVIVAVPSLALIKQSLEDWTKEFLAQNEDPRPEWLVICSDESTAKLEKDEFVSEAYSLGIPTTTDVDEIRSFLSQDYTGRKIIFTTYQSSDRLAEAARKSGFSFDLAILDEAHKTVGIKSKTFATLLMDKNIQVTRRMFMTATERIFNGDNDEVLSMDDPDVYGHLFYQLTFKEAIHAEPPIISDYKILTITVTNEEIEQLIARNKLITDSKNKIEEQESQSMAAAIALRKAIQNYGIKHAISFHRSIKGADNFSNLNRKLNDGAVDDILLQSYHISSKKSAGARASLLDEFVKENPALMTNARCLIEGVDVPAIDCILFADPRQSIIDIVQAVGRALRPSPGKELGYIMLPLIVPEDMDLEEFTESTPFREVARIISALSTQDEMIAEEFRLLTAGKIDRNYKIRIDGKIPIGFKLDLKDFANKINAKIWERIAKVNWRTFPEARSFVHELKLKSNPEWLNYCKSGKKPFDIPASPEVVYLGKGWIGIVDWLGIKIYRPFNEARAFIHGLKFKNQAEWREYCFSANKPDDIPTSPNSTYREEGWVSLGDWLGTGTIATRSREYRSFKEARAFVHTLGLKSGDEWKKYCQSDEKPKDIPNAPFIVYSGKGWIGWGDWLGTGFVAWSKRKNLSFNEARSFVHKLNLRTQSEWIAYCKSGNKPDDIPKNPNEAYRDKGWSGYGDWLGTGRIASQFMKYRPFKEARAFVQNLSLKSGNEWKKYCQTGNKPEDIPAHPDRTYKGKGWSTMGDWLGTGRLANYDKILLPYNEARAYVQKLNLRSYNDWRKYCQSGDKPKGIPASPVFIYRDKGWSGWGDWLGTGFVAHSKRNYLPFNEARAFVHKLKLKNLTEWTEYCHSGAKPEYIPSTPILTYKEKGWSGIRDWLGPRIPDDRSKRYRPFNDARAFVHKLSLKSGNEWKKFCQTANKPEDIPTKPDRVYKGRGWSTMGDWLGTGLIATQLRKYRCYDGAREYVRELRLKNQAEWSAYCKSGRKPNDIPYSPGRVYKEKGWLNFGDWLGTGTVATQLRVYRPFLEAKAFVHKLGLKGENGWRKYCKSGKKPNDLPSAPSQFYRDKGWINWGDWLGKIN
jgi:superfamily II DNA or RNA helicase